MREQMSNLVQQTEEWHELRSNKIGSSDAPVIMETSPWKTPYQLWQEKIFGANNRPNSAMQRGLALEEKAREEFSNLTGLLVAPAVVVHPRHQWMMASLDAKDIEGKNIAEIKCPGKEDHSMALAGKMPDKYYPQVQHQIEVCQLDKAYYFSFDGREGIVLVIYRDDKYISKLIEKEKSFWDKIQELHPPELSQKDYLSKEDDLWSQYASQWIAMNGQLKELEKKEKELREQLISMSQDQNSIGAGVKITKIFRKGNIDYSKIPQLQGIDLEAYRKQPIEYWKVTDV